MSIKEIEQLPDVSEGLENAIKMLLILVTI